MTASSGSNRDQSGGPFGDCLAGVGLRGHIVQGHSAIGMDGGVDILTRAHRADHQRHLVPHAQGQILFEPGIAAMADQIDPERRGRTAGTGLIMRGECGGNRRQPLVELLGRAGIERRKGSDDPAGALRNDKLGA